MAERPDLNTIRTNYQVRTDTLIDYHPRAGGAVDIPFTDSVRMTKTEGALLDTLTSDRGLGVLQEFRDIKDRANDESEKRFPDDRVPVHVPFGAEAEWQNNGGHRDAFRHAYWNALMTQQYGNEWTKAFATAHEGLPGNYAELEAMDLYNNEVGRSIGAKNMSATPEELAKLVGQSLNQGKLLVIDKNGDLEWSDQVPRREHGMSPKEATDPKIPTPDVVPPFPSFKHSAVPGQENTMLAAADAASNVDRMRQDPMYGQVVTAMQAKGLEGDAMAANLYAAAARERLTGVTNIEVGKPVHDANGNPDRNLFVFDGNNGPLGPNHARVSENQARATPVEVAANQAVDARTQQMAAPEQEPRKSVSMTA